LNFDGSQDGADSLIEPPIGLKVTLSILGLKSDPKNWPNNHPKATQMQLACVHLFFRRSKTPPSAASRTTTQPTNPTGKTPAKNGLRQPICQKCHGQDRSVKHPTSAF
jgi:hypothetical protein